MSKRPPAVRQPTCTHCSEPTHIIQGRMSYCAKHYRIFGMRVEATRRGKISPTREEVEALVPNPLICIGCKNPMHWLIQDGRARQASLQHDRDGTLRIICFGCNSKHAKYPGDSFYSVPRDHKICADCTHILPFTDFPICRRQTTGRGSYCRKCSAKQHQVRKARRKEIT